MRHMRLVDGSSRWPPVDWWRRTTLAILCLGVLGCGTREPPMKQSLARYDDCGLTLRLRHLTAGSSEASTVELVEEVQNTSDRPICFAMRTVKRQIVQIATSRIVEGNRKLQYHSQPVALCRDGTELGSLLQIVDDFPWGEGACDGGEILGPSQTTTYPSDSFTILRAGLYRVQSEWSVDILDASDASRYRVLGKCTIRSNALDLDILNDVQETGKKREGNKSGTGPIKQ